MADPMRIRAAVRDGVVNVKVLMSHEMETGQRKDAAGKLVPAQWGPAISKNPYLEFNFKGGQKGEKVIVIWEDNKGEKRSDEATIA